LATDAGEANEAVQIACLLLGTERTHDEAGRRVGDLLFDAQERTRRLYRLRGTDLAETISERALRRRTEVQGPRSRDARERRE